MTTEATVVQHTMSPPILTAAVGVGVGAGVGNERHGRPGRKRVAEGEESPPAGRDILLLLLLGDSPADVERDRARNRAKGPQ